MQRASAGMGIYSSELCLLHGSIVVSWIDCFLYNLAEHNKEQDAVIHLCTLS